MFYKELWAAPIKYSTYVTMIYVVIHIVVYYSFLFVGIKNPCGYGTEEVLHAVKNVVCGGPIIVFRALYACISNSAKAGTGNVEEVIIWWLLCNQLNAPILFSGVHIRKDIPTLDFLAGILCNGQKLTEHECWTNLLPETPTLLFGRAICQLAFKWAENWTLGKQTEGLSLYILLTELIEQL